MKELKNKLDLSEQLLQARTRNLNEIGILRPHGKLWGMDVFSWYNPTIFEIENTLASFPSPVIWFANEKSVLQLLDTTQNWLPNVKLVCIYDKGGFVLPNEVLDEIETVLGCKEIEDALDLIKVLKMKQGIFLFTASGEKWKEQRDSFESYLEIHQAK
jgi:hypothetical protein